MYDTAIGQWKFISMAYVSIIEGNVDEHLQSSRRAKVLYLNDTITSKHTIYYLHFSDLKIF